MQTESAKCPECRHIFPGGERCHSPALRGKACCYYHCRQRSLIAHNRYRTNSVALPPLEDRAAIQMAINEVLAAFAGNKIDRRQAGIYLYGLQIASSNLTRAGDLAASNSVTGFSDAPWDEVLATDQPGEEPDRETAAPELAAEPATKADTCLPFHDDSETHEYDPQPVRPPTEKQQQRAREFALSYQTHMIAKEFEEAGASG